MTYKNLLKVIPTLQAASLVKYNVDITKKKKLKSDDMIKISTTNIVGSNIIKLESDFISGL